MPTDRTVVTELATALGTVPYADLGAALASRTPVLRIDDATWDRLAALHAGGGYARDFASAYAEGVQFARAQDGLRGRPPHVIEWTAGRRPTGDEVAPIDLRIDHVYLVSCKYLSANLANASPARLFDGLLATTGDWRRDDWYLTVAPDEYQALYDACVAGTGLTGLPASVAELNGSDRQLLRRAIGDRVLPPAARAAYEALCESVSVRSAARWAERLARFSDERMLWRLLRIGNAPYFLLGARDATGSGGLRLRIDTTWDWHRAYRLERIGVTPASAGQPRVDWWASYALRATGETRSVEGHVEIRWSHGRFGQPPEAKIYLDTAVDEVPGYHPLVPAEVPSPLFALGASPPPKGRADPALPEGGEGSLPAPPATQQALPLRA